MKEEDWRRKIDKESRPEIEREAKRMVDKSFKNIYKEVEKI